MNNLTKTFNGGRWDCRLSLYQANFYNKTDRFNNSYLIGFKSAKVVR